MTGLLSQRGPGRPVSNRARPVAGLLLGVALTMGNAKAQFDQSPESAGEKDGRIQGIADGRDLGRAQQMLSSYIDAFSHSLKELTDADRVAAVDQQARSAGLLIGKQAALEEAHAKGSADARASWLKHLSSRPHEATSMPPADAPESGASKACHEADSATLTFPSGRTVAIDSRDLDTVPFPLTPPFERPYPPDERLRQRARDNGSSSAAVSDWLVDYKRAFDTEYFDSFSNQREGTPAAMRDRFAEMGRIAGQAEGIRREACAAWNPAWQDGWSAGREAGWKEGHRAGWNETDTFHSESAVVLFESARVTNLSGTELLEPGGEAELHVEYINAGGIAVNRSSGRFTLIRGGHTEGRLTGNLAGGARRTEVHPLGTLDPAAPTGSSVVVLLKGLGGARRTVVAKMGRPIIIDALSTRLEVREGRLVAVADVTLKGLGPYPGELSISSQGLAQELASIPHGEVAHVEVTREAALPAALEGPLLGTIELRGQQGQSWQRMTWRTEIAMGRAVSLVATLADPASATDGIATRLMEELQRASESEAALVELELFAEAFSLLPAGTARQQLDAKVNEALRARVREKSTPRQIRKAVKSILGT